MYRRFVHVSQNRTPLVAVGTHGEPSERDFTRRPMTLAEQYGAHLSPELRSCEAIQEHIAAVVHIENRLRGVQPTAHALSRRERIRSRHGVQVLAHAQRPHDEVGQVEQDERRRHADEDDVQVERHRRVAGSERRPTVATSSAVQTRADEDVERCYDDERHAGDEHPVDGVQVEDERLLLHLQRAHVALRRATHLAQDRLVKAQQERERAQTEDDTSGALAASAGGQRPAHADVAFNGEGDDEPG